MDWNKYEKTLAKIAKDEQEMAGLLVGRKVTGIKYSSAYPGHVAMVHIMFDNGASLDITALTGGCSECDPEGFGIGLDITHVKARKEVTP